jgi:hypothetical protein
MKFLLPLLALATTTWAKLLVPLEIHIMSQCPDAADCASQLLSPALPEIANITAFTLSFIGSTTDEGVTCKHGPAECAGNMLHLCGAHLSMPPRPVPVQRYWGFTECLLSDYGRMGDREFVEHCAKMTEGEWGLKEIERCAGDVGEELLRKSVERSREAGVKTSCTVRLRGKTVCVRDGGVWKDCLHGNRPEDLVRLVREAYEEGEEKLGLHEQSGRREDGRLIWLEL